MIISTILYTCLHTFSFNNLVQPEDGVIRAETCCCSQVSIIKCCVWNICSYFSMHNATDVKNGHKTATLGQELRRIPPSDKIQADPLTENGYTSPKGDPACTSFTACKRLSYPRFCIFNQHPSAKHEEK